MKKFILKAASISLVLLLNIFAITGQVPQGFNYMAIARDGAGDILPNTDLKVRIAILSSTDPLLVIWEEEHAVKTNETGLFQLIIGDPLAQIVEGGSAPSFADIDWTVQPVFVRTSIYLSEEWVVMGDARLFSVPYAMVSGSAYNGVSNPFITSGDSILISKSVGIGTDNLHKAKLAVMGDDALTEDPLFEVKRKDGQTMFAVYNQGVRINVPLIDNVKGPKGGFAIGGFSASKAGVQDLFSLNKDSVRFYIDKTPDLIKGAKGGFAIGGFELAGKADIQNYLSVTPDSTRIYIKEGTKGAKGGFAIGGFSGTKASTGNFLDITKENYFIGHESGLNTTTGLYNSFIGYQAGYTNTSGRKNYFIGYKAGFSNTTGFSNTFIGDSSGYQNTTGYFNSFIGNWSGYSNISGYKNTIIGHRAGFANTSGICNVFIGPDAGGKNTTAWYNTFVGIGTGYNTTSGGYNSYYGINSGYAMKSGSNNAFYGSNAGYWFDGGYGNTFIGAEAGRGGPDSDPADPDGNYNTLLGSFSGTVLENASNNVMLGAYSGKSMRTGTNNVFIGYQSGYLETGSNKLYITGTHNYDTHQPISPTNPGPILIYGDLAANKLGINTYTLNKTLNVGGDAEITGNLSAASVSAPLTGNVTGNVTGNLTGDVSGNLTGNVTGSLTGNVSGSVTGDVTGNLTGDVNGLSVGKINLREGGVILFTAAGNMELTWDFVNDKIMLNNKMTYDIAYWWKSQKDGASDGKTGIVPAGEMNEILTGVHYPLAGFEIHFGQANGYDGWCSVWLQYMDATMVGHYMKY